MRSHCLRLLSLAVLSVAPAGQGLAQSFVKVNVATTLVGVPGIAYERTLSERVSFQFDATVSPWRSVSGVPAQFAILIPEWRFHPRGVARGIYFGAHAGASVFRLQKWDHRNSDEYQEGAGLLFGATVGYQWRVRRNLIIDAFVGGGTAQSLYKGYSRSTGERYDGAVGWNKSGEWLPYRGGVMLAFPLR